MFKVLVLVLIATLGGIVSWQLEAHVHSTRWSVKTLADGFEPDTTVVPSSIGDQCTLKSVLTDESTARQTTEHTLYRVEGNLIQYKLEVDNDYHLVIEDPKTHHRMIAEIPDGDNTPAKYAVMFKKARRQFDREVGTPGFFETELDTPRHIVVTGLGFFDEPHWIPQAGMAVNCREIHPVMSIALK